MEEMSAIQERRERIRFIVEMFVAGCTVAIGLGGMAIGVWQARVAANTFQAAEQNRREDRLEAIQQRKAEMRPVLIPIDIGTYVKPREEESDTTEAVPYEIMNVGRGPALSVDVQWKIDSPTAGSLGEAPAEQCLQPGDKAVFSGAPFSEIEKVAAKLIPAAGGTDVEVLGTLIITCTTVDSEYIQTRQRFIANVDKAKSSPTYLLFEERTFVYFAGREEWMKDNPDESSATAQAVDP